MSQITELRKEIKALKKELDKVSLFRKRIYTIKEAAIVAGVSTSYIHKLIASNQIPYSKPSGKLVFIRRRDLEKFLMKDYIPSLEDTESSVANHLISHFNNKI